MVLPSIIIATAEALGARFIKVFCFASSNNLQVFYPHQKIAFAANHQVGRFCCPALAKTRAIHTTLNDRFATFSVKPVALTTY